MASGAEQGTFRYRGFISYAHRDQGLARRLHRALESYRVPTAFASGLASNRRLGRFFRDDDEMSGAADLGVALRGAIEESEALVVICSPAAARSKWVNSEIEHFKKSGRAHRIFAVVASGEPNAASEESECFPHALRFDAGADGSSAPTQGEPLAVDLRKDGWGRATVRLIAGLMDAPFDAFWQRDRRQRRARIVASTIVAASLLLFLPVVVVGGAYLTLTALQAGIYSAAQNDELGLVAVQQMDGKIFLFEGDAAKAHCSYTPNADAGQPLIPTGFTGSSPSFAFHGDKLLAPYTTRVVVLDPRTCGEIARFDSERYVTAATLDARRGVLFIGGNDGFVTRYDLSVRQEHSLGAVREPIHGMRASADGRFLLAQSDSAGPRLWSLADKKLVFARNAGEGHAPTYGELVGDRLVIADPRRSAIEVFPLDGGTPGRLDAPPAQVWALKTSSDKLLVIHPGSGVSIFSAGARRPLFTDGIDPSRRRRARAADISENYSVSALPDNEEKDFYRVVDLRDGRLLCSFSLDGDPPLGLLIAERRRRVIAHTLRGQLLEFDLSTCSRTKRVRLTARMGEAFWRALGL